MKTGHHNQDSIIASAARVFWKTKQFWGMILPIVLSCMVIGYLMGSWYAAAAYKEQSESRKAILAQCLTNNDKLSSQLADIAKSPSTER